MLVPRRIYNIKNEKSGSALGQSRDMVDGSSSSTRALKTIVAGERKQDDDYQKWYIGQFPSGLYFVKNIGTGEYIGLEPGNFANHACATSVNYEFEWDIVADEDDLSVYRFFIPGTTFNLGLIENDPHDGGIRVAIWEKCQSERNQCWILEQLAVPM